MDKEETSIILYEDDKALEKENGEQQSDTLWAKSHSERQHTEGDGPEVSKASQ